MTPAAPPGFRGAFHTDPGACRPYASASGPVRLEPRAVAVPADPDDVGTLVEWASAEGVALVPRGAGTGMPGGNVGRSVVVDLAASFAGIGPVDHEGRRVEVGAGAVVAAVDAAAVGRGLTFPPLPSSADRCTVGGMVANNAAGARSFRHGAVRAWVEALDVVGADGRRLRLERGRPGPAPFPALRDRLADRLGASPAGWPAVRKNSSGYALDAFLPTGDAVDLVTGSEGTLALVVGATLRLAPRPPRRGVVLLGLPEVEAVPPAAARARESEASACEMFGRRIIEMAGLGDDPLVGPSARDAEALLLVELEGDEEAVAAGVAAMESFARSLGTASVTATDPADRERLWGLRHRASPLIARAAERGRVSIQFIEDSVVPPDALARYVRGLEAILAAADTDAVVFGHAGDGHLHVNPLVDVRRPGWRRTVRRILEETVELVGGLGGTLSGEHGDGRVRAPYMERIWPSPLVEAFLEVKDTLDPRGILNPGVVLPLPDQDPLEGLGAGFPDAA